MNDVKSGLTMWYATGILALFCVCSACAQADDPQIGDKPVSGWIKQLRSENRGLQMRAARALTEAPVEVRPALVPMMMTLLGSERENDHFVAAQVLGECGPMARPAVMKLLPLLAGTQFERNRAAAAKALGQILRDAPASDEVEQVTQRLLLLFKDQYSDVRREAVTACGMIGPAAKACIPELPMLFDDVAYHGKPAGGPSRSEMYMVHSAAAWAAGRMGPLAACHVDRMISMLQGDRDVSTTVVWAIGEIGPVNDSVIPNMMSRLEKALVGGGFAVGAQSLLIGDIKEGSLQEYRDYCFDALAKFGVKAKQTTPLMHRCISEGNWYGNNNIRNAIGAFKVLRAVGPDAREALPALEDAVKIEHFDNRIPKETVAQFKNEAKAALAAVKP